MKNILYTILPVTLLSTKYKVTVALASARDKLDNGVTYGGEIIHADPDRACEGHGLGLMSIEVIVGKKIVL